MGLLAAVVNYSENSLEIKRHASIRPTVASAAAIHEVHGLARLLNAADRRFHLFHVRFVNCEATNLGAQRAKASTWLGWSAGQDRSPQTPQATGAVSDSLTLATRRIPVAIATYRCR